MYSLETLKEVRDFLTAQTKPFNNGKIVASELYELYSGGLPKDDFCSLVCVIGDVSLSDWNHAHKDHRPTFLGLALK